MKVNVTVCQLSDDPAEFESDWRLLFEHVKIESSQLVLLPEMPFHPWFACERDFDPSVWKQALRAHDDWELRLSDLAPAVILGSRPVYRNGKRLNEGFVWDARIGYRAAHHKYYLPDEEGFWEASWYERGDGRFVPAEAAGLSIGFEICTDMWFMHRARAYGREGTHVIATPRATERSTSDKWLAGARATAVVSGAYSISSNRTSDNNSRVEFGGQGWIIGPDGEVLGLTSDEQPFLTLEIDIEKAEQAKSGYPRYVPD